MTAPLQADQKQRRITKEQERKLKELNRKKTEHDLRNMGMCSICSSSAQRELNFEYNDRRNKIIPKEVQAKHPRASSVTNT